MMASDCGEPSHCSSSHACFGYLVWLFSPSIRPLNTLTRPVGPIGSVATPTGKVTPVFTVRVFQSPCSHMATWPWANICSRLLLLAFGPDRVPGTMTWSPVRYLVRNVTPALTWGVARLVYGAPGYGSTLPPASAT